MILAPSHPEPLTLTRRRGFGLSVAAAFVLNGLAIGAFAAAVTRWHAPAGAQSVTALITTFNVARPTPEPAASSPPTPTRAMAEPNRAVAEAALPPPLTVAASPKAPPAARDGGSTVRFYRSSEVDRPAEPDSDWNLDTAVLDAAGVERLVFEMFIGHNGEVIGCTILEPASLDTQARQTIEERLRQTTLKPAIRGGTAVASVRRIEVSAAPPGQ